MKSLIEKYAEASDASDEVMGNFDRLQSQIGDLPENPTEAARQVMSNLAELGFKYKHPAFTLQDVLANCGGNCLGYPLLIGSVLGESGFDPRFKIVVNPQDEVYKIENMFCQRYNDEVQYGVENLATEKDEAPVMRFAPLEHLVLDMDGEMIETTADGSIFYDFESSRDISFDEALSCVLKDRAAFAANSEQYKSAESLSERGLELWTDNRALHYLLGGVKLALGDEQGNRGHIDRFKEIDGDDSLYNFNLYLIEGDNDNLDKSLEQYPFYADALAAKAESLATNDPREARFGFGLASHCFANSTCLNLVDFYKTYQTPLIGLFGEDRIKQIEAKL